MQQLEKGQFTCTVYCVVPENIQRPPPPSPTEGFLVCTPLHPSGNSSLAPYFSLKTFAFAIAQSLLEFSLTLCGGGMDNIIIWNCTSTAGQCITRNVNEQVGKEAIMFTLSYFIPYNKQNSSSPLVLLPG